jgi:hypothetical protein
MKRALPVALLVLVAIAAYFFFRPSKTPTGGSQLPASVPETSSNQPLPGTSPATAASAPEPGANPATATAPASAPTNVPPAALNAANPSSAASPPPGVPPEILVQNVRRAIRQYGAMFGGNPVGTNPEITAQLSGKNPKGVNFINADAGMRVNAQGEMVDSWGTPLFFHQLSGTDTEVRSAGPDKVMWTSDDLVSP